MLFSAGAVRGSFWRGDNLVRERFKARVAAERREKRVDPNKGYVRPGVVLIAFLQPAESLVLFSEREMDAGDGRGPDITMLCNCLHLVQDFPDFRLVPGRAMSMRQESEDERVVV